MYHNYQPSTLEYTKLFSIVYAVLSLSFGIIFPIAEALKDQWLDNVDNTIFLTFTLTTSSAFLVYLLFYNLRTSKKRPHPSSRNYLDGILSSMKTKLLRTKNKKEDKPTNEPTSNVNGRSNIKIIIDPPDSSIDNLKKLKNHSSLVSFESLGGIDLGILKKIPSQQSIHKSDLLLNSREVQPATDIRLKPYMPYRRKSVCMTIKENSVEESHGLQDFLKKQERFQRDEQTSDKKEDDENSLNEKDENKLDDEEDEDEPLTWIDAESFGSVFTHHGSNLFLRLGALVFGLGNMVNYALEIQANLITNKECSNNMRFKWIFIWMFVFVLLQTFFLFKHSKIKVTKHQSLVWLGMVHLIFTNINLWIHNLAREIIVEYKHKLYLHHFNSNTTAEFEGKNCDSNLLHSASIYLIPFVLEYSLIAVGIISSFLYFGAIESTSMADKANRNLIKVFSMAQDDFNNIYNNSDNNLKAQSNNKNSNNKVRFGPLTEIISQNSEKINKILIKKKKEDLSQTLNNTNHNPNNNTNNNTLSHQNNPNNNTLSHQNSHHEIDSLQKSHAGLFAGMVVLCITVVTCVIFLFSQLQHNRARAEIVYFSTDITVHSLLMIACVSACIKTRKLAFAPKPITTDDILLLLAAFGSLTFELTNASALFSALRTSPDSPDLETFVTTPFSPLVNGTNRTSTESFIQRDLDPFHRIRDHLQLASACLGMIQTAVQTLLIFVSLRRYPVTLHEATEMPGRGTMAFLIVGNLSVWILRTVLCKNLELPVQVNFFGHVGCLLLTDIHLPLLLFFRFHSSVCFADVWSCAYRLLTRFPNNSQMHTHGFS